MAAARAQERAETVQRSHPARQAGSAPKHPREGAQEVFPSLDPSWRKGSCCQPLSLPPPPLAAIPLRVPGRGEEMPGRGSSLQPLGRQIGQAQVMRGGTELERLLPSLHLSPAWYG